MVEEVKVYSAVCDGCNGCLEMHEMFTAYADKQVVQEAIQEDEDWSILEDGKVYCPDCHTLHWDEEEDEQFACSKDTEASGAQLLGKVL